MEDGGKIAKEEGGGRAGAPKFYYARNIFFTLDWTGSFLVRCPAGKAASRRPGTPPLPSVHPLGFTVTAALSATEQLSKTFFFCPAASATGGRTWWGAAGR